MPGIIAMALGLSRMIIGKYELRGSTVVIFVS